MKPMDLDPSLAYTALLDLDREFRTLTVDAAADEKAALLADWYAQTTVPNLYAFTKQWLAQRDTATERQIAAAFRTMTSSPRAVGHPGFADYHAGWVAGTASREEGARR